MRKNLQKSHATVPVSSVGYDYYGIL